MVDLYEKAADHFLELASPQRLQILFKLSEKSFSITEMANDFSESLNSICGLGIALILGVGTFLGN